MFSEIPFPILAGIPFSGKYPSRFIIINTDMKKNENIDYYGHMIKINE